MDQKTKQAGRWYVIHTKTNEQERADFNLRAWGLETFNPKTRQPRYNEITGKPTYYTKPLFPRYIFARFDADSLLHKVCFTRGVSSVLSFGEGPVVVEDEVIEFLQSRVGADGFVQAGEELKSGDRVVVKDGTFKDLGGVFEAEVNESDRVRILLTSLNCRGSIVIERQLLKKVV